MARAVAHARARRGPALVRARVIRPYSHSLSDDEQLYKTAAQRAEEARSDPLATYPARLLALGDVTEAELEAPQGGGPAEVDRAWAEAEAAPPPDSGSWRQPPLQRGGGPLRPGLRHRGPRHGHAAEGGKTMIDLINTTLRQEMDRDPAILAVRRGRGRRHPPRDPGRR